MHRPLAKCTACRVSVLEAFASLAGISIAARPPRQQLFQPQVRQCRAFSRITALRQSPDTPSIPPASEQRHHTGPDPSAATSIPWYLQVEEPAPPMPNTATLAMQEVPPLPSDPPPILHPILEHLSIQIGLDNLVLLDLRHLEPPSALGANLLMIIGTARSVKHLNVSADRFCRWVRQMYKLRPYADGLLGRNELKLKLRRKAKKLRLAQSVGNTVAMQNPDDGITTGWICVNMGPVDEAVLPEVDGEEDGGEQINDLQAASEDVAEDEEEEYRNPSNDHFVGFGSRVNSPRIVVQIFTEEKRLEMDLEGLWAARNTRRARRDERANAVAESVVEMLQERE